MHVESRSQKDDHATLDLSDLDRKMSRDDARSAQICHKTRNISAFFESNLIVYIKRG